MKENPINFKAAFKFMPGNTILIKPDAPFYTILAVTNETIERSGLSEEQLINKPFFDPFPANPENPDDPNVAGQNIVLASFEHVIRHRELHRLPVIRYDLANGDGSFSELYWSVYNKPVTDNDGNLLYILHTSEDITEKVKAQKKEEEIKEIRQAHNLLLQAPVAIQVFRGPDLIIELANKLTQELWGRDEHIIGKRFLEVLPELRGHGYDELMQEVINTGQSKSFYETPIVLNKGGKMETGYYNFVYQPYYEEYKTKAAGILVFANDVTDKVLARKKLEESEDRFRTLADNIPLMAFTIEPTPEIRVSYWNKTWLDYTGKTFDEALGRAWDRVIHPDDEQSVMDVYLPAFEKREPYILPAVRIKRYDGQYRWHSVKSNPRYLPGGEFIGYIGVMFDIHESKLATDALRESEAHFRQMADLMPAKITNANPDGGVTYYNKHWLEYAGMSFKELKDFGYHNIMHPDELEEFGRLLDKAAATGTTLEMEMRFRNKEGEYIWHLNRATPVTDDYGKVKFWVGVTTEIQKMKEEEKLKDIFLSMASHELKTPVTTIKTYGQIAESILEAKGDLQTLDIVKNMSKQVNRLTTLITDLLDINKIQNGKLVYNETFFDFNELVKEVTVDMQKTSVTHEIINQFASTTRIFGDRDKISQVLNNLISNAIKYSPTADKIVLSTALQNEGIKLCVQDFGIGIPDEEKHKIFEQFYRVSGNNKSTFPGMGIGLYICSEIIKNQGGKIWVENSTVKGSIFCIWLPFDHRAI